MGRNDRKRNSGYERPEATRNTRKTTDSKDLLTFSFRHFDQTQPKNDVQTIALWVEQGLISDLIRRLQELSGLTRAEAEQQKQIKIYGGFPERSDFEIPRYITHDVEWGIIKKVGGQMSGVAGYIMDDTFYIVFLDKNHRFWITDKKHT